MEKRDPDLGTRRGYRRVNLPVLQWKSSNQLPRGRRGTKKQLTGVVTSVVKSPVGQKEGVD